MDRDTPSSNQEWPFPPEFFLDGSLPVFNYGTNPLTHPNPVDVQLTGVPSSEPLGPPQLGFFPPFQTQNIGSVETSYPHSFEMANTSSSSFQTAPPMVDSPMPPLESIPTNEVLNEENTTNQVDEQDQSDNDSVIEIPICKVCMNTSSNGIHFGVLTCDACSAFFRRSIALGKQYVCNRNERCKSSLRGVSGYRKLCRQCRLDRCFKAGMLTENVRIKKPRQKAIPNFEKQLPDLHPNVQQHK